MQIRRAEAADEEALRRIRHGAILGLAGTGVSVQQAAQWAARAPADRIARAIREHEVWVAVEEGPIAWVEIDGDRIAALYVAPTVSRCGVGSKLLLLAETAIRRAGCATARLEASENALGFYLRRGYLRSGPQASDGSYPMTKDLAGMV